MRLRTPWIALPAVIAGSMMVSGCGDDNSGNGNNPPPGQPGVPAQVIVDIPAGATGMGPAAYGQNPLVIAPGTQVTWMNRDSVAHTATSDTGAWDSGPIAPGQSFSFTFSREGSFPYYCAIHGRPSMSGMIQVTNARPSPSASPSASMSPMPTPSVTTSPSPSPSPTASMVMVTIQPGATGKGTAAYGTNPLVIPRGTRVMWTNSDTVPHTVTSSTGAFDSETMSPGATFAHVFNSVGDYPYFCGIHGQASMSGMVRVAP